MLLIALACGIFLIFYNNIIDLVKPAPTYWLVNSTNGATLVIDASQFSLNNPLQGRALVTNIIKIDIGLGPNNALYWREHQ